MEGRQPFVLGSAAVSGSGSGGGSGDGVGSQPGPGLQGPSDRDRTSVPVPAPPADASASSRDGGVTAPLSVPDRSVHNTAQDTATIAVKAAVKATTLPLAV
ncbi:GTPase activating factor, partial [Neurospora sp. IMI 360204]